MSANQRRSAAMRKYHANRKRKCKEFATSTVRTNKRDIATLLRGSMEGNRPLDNSQNVDTLNDIETCGVQEDGINVVYEGGATLSENIMETCDVHEVVVYDADHEEGSVEQNTALKDSNCNEMDSPYYWREETNDLDANFVDVSKSQLQSSANDSILPRILRTRASYQNANNDAAANLSEVMFGDVSDIAIHDDHLCEAELIEQEATELMRSTFDVMEETYTDLLDQLCAHKPLSDAKEPIMPGVNTTKEECAAQISSFCALNSIKRQHRDDFLKLMFSMTEGKVQFPVTITSRNNIVSKLDQYTALDWRSKQFHICKKGGCCAYVGQFAGLKICPEPSCQFPRYTLCKCRMPDPECLCDTKTRVPQRILQYRSLISLFHELLQYPYFQRAINCIYSSGRGMVRNILDSANARLHIEEMHARYVQSKEDAIEVSLLLGNFYDGTQPYRHSQQNFWPCLFSILNLPPSYRTRLGVGTFMISLFTGTMDSASEVFLFRDLLVQELLRLEQGITLEVDNVRYYVQARCLVYTFDTPAFGKVMKIKTSGSLSGCPICRHGKGVNFPCYTNVKYIGTRCLLPLDHFLRKFGQSGQCCPPGYYEYSSANCDDKDQWMLDVFRPVNDTNGRKIHVCMSIGTINKVTPCCAINNPSAGIRLKEFLKKIYEKQNSVAKNDEINHSWFHCLIGNVSVGDPSLERHRKDLYNHLSFHHADFREPEAYQLKLHTDLLEWNRLRMECNLKEYNGVKGLPEMMRLNTFSSHLCAHFDPWHTFENLMSYLLEIFSGRRDYGGCAEYLKQAQCHHELWNAEPSNQKKQKKANSASTRPPFVLSSDTMNVVEACLNAVIYPVGMSKEFQIKSIFSKSGFLRGAGKIRLLTTFLRLIVSVTELPLSYRLLAMLIQDDVAMLMAPEVPVDHAGFEDMKNKLFELCSLWEGLFPISENNLVIHQLIHLPGMLETLGPLKGIWAASGERNVGFIKNTTNKGGVGVEITVQNNYGAYEKSMIVEAYSDEPQVEARSTTQRLNNDINDATCVSFNDGQMHYDDHQSFLEAPCMSPSLSEFEQRHIIDALLQAVRFDVVNGEDVPKSSFYRLCEVYANHIKERYRGSIEDIYSWLKYCHEYNERGTDNLGIFQELCSNGSIFTERSIQQNELQVATEILKFSLRSFENAIVQGSRIRGRGAHCREKKLGEELKRRYGEQRVSSRIKRYPSNPENSLNNWSEKNHVSSWMMAYDPIARKDYFCQLNFGLRIQCSDPVVCSQRILSIVRRFHDYGVDQIARVKRDRFGHEPYTSLEPPVFVGLNGVYSMPIAVLGFDNVSKPIMTKYFDGDAILAAERKTNKRYYSESKNLDHICLFPGKPERRILNSWFKQDN